MSIEAHGIRKKFGSYTALDGVDLNVPQGKLVALLGPSGSGKTTLLRIIAGLEFPDPGSGRILFHGDDVTDVPAGRRQVGFVFQHYALFRHMTVFDNVAFGLRVKRRRERPSASAIAERAHRLLELVQLDGLRAGFPPSSRAASARGWPSPGPSPSSPRCSSWTSRSARWMPGCARTLRRWLRRFHDEIHLTTIFVTHDQEEALEIADEVVIMNKAHVEQVGTPQQVYDKPASPFVYQFLGNVNILRAPALVGARSRPGRAAVDNPEGLIYVRPHDIELAPHDSGGSGLSAIVRHIHAAGPQARLLLEQVQTREPIEAEISRSELADLNLQVNDLVLLRLRQTHSFDDDYAI